MTDIALTVTDGVAGLAWADVAAELDGRGFAVTPPVLEPEECLALATLFDDGARFRSTVDMARHRFGDGRYRYFDHPLPDVVAELRAAFYERLAPVANAWWERLGLDGRFPLEHEE